jgi:signal transduction histidine kinase
MKKREIIMQIRAAKSSHIRWKSYVQIALRGIVTDQVDAALPIVQTECDFGKWYYGDGMFLSLLTNFQSLEHPHEMLHEMYIQIYTLQKAKLQGGFFTSKRKMLRKRQKEIGQLVANLNDYSKIMMETLQQLEIEVLRMNSSEISNLYDMEDDDTSKSDNNHFFGIID